MLETVVVERLWIDGKAYSAMDAVSLLLRRVSDLERGLEFAKQRESEERHKIYQRVVALEKWKLALAEARPQPGQQERGEEGQE